jgi:hypothetical protein
MSSKQALQTHTFAFVLSTGTACDWRTRQPSDLDAAELALSIPGALRVLVASSRTLIATVASALAATIAQRLTLPIPAAHARPFKRVSTASARGDAPIARGNVDGRGGSAERVRGSLEEPSSA